ncbi:PAS domain S-box protein [Flavobacterium supellecticarium]|uniref:histidine kinase n=1 Tax=Flavobacterium supellecticarium TaxID=2565924 RepID=A0A4S4A499_9FLAO|nr:PAS domain-containing sensor histidine kinase [Flavobacterium supellecticarium]THF53304.1 PAS domain S-box protein [Flavobacterium supellecticarium]
MHSAKLQNMWNDALLNNMQRIGKEGVFIVDFEGNIVRANKNALVAFGLDEKIYQGRSCFELFRLSYDEDSTPLDKKELPFSVTLQYGKTIENKLLGVAIEMKPLTWLSVSTQMMPISDLKYVIISFFDVTEIVTKSQKLEKRKNQLDALLASIDDMIFEVSATGVILNCWTNDKDQLFYEPSLFLGKNLEALFPGELGCSFVALIKDSLSQNKSLSMDYQSPVQTNSGLWYRMQARPIYSSKSKVAVIITDITNRMKIEEEVRINEQKFNQAFLHSGLGMALVDTEGHCIDVNKTLIKMLGYDLSEMARMSCCEYTHPDDLLLVEENIKKLKSLESESFTIKKRYIHKEGHYIWCLLTMSTVFNQQGSPVFFIAQVQDITLYSKYVQTLQRNNRQLEIATIDLETKLRQLEEFNQIVAHNLRGPAGNIQMLVAEIEHADNEADRKECLQLLQSSSDGLIAIMEELIEILEVRGSKSLPFEECNFERLYKKTIQQFSAEIYAKSAVIETNFEINAISYSRIYLESILHNLIGNALKYTIPGRKPHIYIRSYVEEGKSCLSVSDNGVGIDLERHGTHIFKFRKTFHTGYDSKGIGLFMTRHQIESLGGRMYVESEPDKGSTFYIQFN